MILLIMLGLALLLMLPLAFIFIPGLGVRTRREAALALHRAQLVELQHEHADERIGNVEYEAAKLEVERRLLAADALTPAPMNGNARLLLIGTLVALPIMGFALYLPGSTPGVPSEPHAAWAARQAAEDKKLDKIISILRLHLAQVAPDSANASQGQAYLAEALTEKAGAITPEALALFRQSLAHAPQNASWRALDSQRIAQAEAAASQ